MGDKKQIGEPVFDWRELAQTLLDLAGTSKDLDQLDKLRDVGLALSATARGRGEGLRAVHSAKKHL